LVLFQNSLISILYSRNTSHSVGFLQGPLRFTVQCARALSATAPVLLVVRSQGTLRPVLTARTIYRLHCLTRSSSQSSHTCWSLISAASHKFADDLTPSPMIPKFGMSVIFFLYVQFFLSGLPFVGVENICSTFR